MQDRIEFVETLWADFATPIATADDYINSLRGRRMNVFFMGERVPEPVDHPVIRPSINAMAETYRLATERPELATAHSEHQRARRINRFLHVPTSPGDLVAKHEMQRELGRRTGTCFQRCVGLDAIGTCHSVTFDIDGKTRHRLSPALPRLPRARAGGQRRDRRRDDRPQGRPLQGAAPAGRSRPVPACGAARRQRHLRLGRQDAPDRRGQFALADLHADHAPDRSRPRLGGGRRGARRCARAHLHRRPADQRHPHRRRRRDRRRQRAVRRPGIADRLRRRVRAARARLHGRRVGLCVVAGRALHDLSPLVLRLQNRPGRRADRRGGVGRRAQRRRERPRTSRTSSSR